MSYKPLEIVADGDIIELHHYNDMIDNTNFIEGVLTGGGTTAPVLHTGDDINLTYQNRSVWSLTSARDDVAIPLYFDQKMTVSQIVVEVTYDANKGDPRINFNDLDGSSNFTPTSTVEGTYYTATFFLASPTTVEAGTVWLLRPQNRLRGNRYGIFITIRGVKA